MKVIDLLNKIANGEEVPKKIKFYGKYYIWYDNIHTGNEGYCLEPLKSDSNSFLEINTVYDLNYEVEIIEEKKKFTKEDFINERMEIDKITRKEFDEMYEVKECNCGMPYCKGFIAVDKEEPQEHKIPEKLYHCCMETNDEKIKFLIQNINDMSDKINEILDYLEEIE